MSDAHEMPADIAALPAAPYVLLDDNRTPEAGGQLFADPVEIVRCDDPAELDGAMARIGGAPERGLHAAGFLAYELGYLLEPKLAPLLPPLRKVPLIWMGLFRDRRTLSRGRIATLLDRHAGALPGGGACRIERLRASMDREAYGRAFRRVRDYIAAGDVYQINLTFDLLFELAGDPLALYRDLRRKQHVAYGSVIATGAETILSLSPELFVRVEGQRITAKPMKGTAARGATIERDAEAVRWLAADAKSRAENLMIVDLVRNDLGRTAEIGSVKVEGLFEVETYDTVHQMISTVSARLKPGWDAGGLIRSLFPCGSVTGAPKLRAMEIIRELESDPREIYTGAIGAIAPDGTLCFNVAIRTLLLGPDGSGEMGIGSGLVYDSDEAAEYEECLLKSRFLTAPYVPFELIETLRWEREGGYVLLERHLDRLERSARYFGFACNRGEIEAALARAAADFEGDCSRVRLLLAEDGSVRIAAHPMPAPAAGATMRYGLSDRRTDSRDPFLYHKTTRRELYDGEFERWRARTGADEVLFVNERGELTEGSRTNLFIERGGRLLTPALACGLLDGTLRRDLLESGRAEEAILRPEDLAGAGRVYLGNSVRGLVRAEPLAAHAAAE